MAQFPSQPVAQKSYDFRTLGLGYANLGTLLMVQGIPYDSPEGRAQCGALTALMHAASYATSAEIAAEVGPFPRYEANRDAMLRVIRNHRRAAYNAPPSEYEGLTITPVGIDAALLPATTCSQAARRESRPHARARREARLSATPRSPCIAPTGTIGLVMDCDTTGIEPDFALVKFKKLAGGGYFKIINASIPPALDTARLHAAADRRHRPLLPRRRHARRLPAHQPGSAQGQGLHRRRARRRSKRSCPAPSSCRSSSTAGRSATTSCNDKLRLRPRAARRARRSTCSPHLGFTRAADRRGQRLRLRHHDHRRRAAPEARALPGLRLRQQVRQDRPALPVGRVAHPHDGRRPAVHLRRDLQDDQHAARRDGRGREERLPARAGS